MHFYCKIGVTVLFVCLILLKIKLLCLNCVHKRYKICKNLVLFLQKEIQILLRKFMQSKFCVNSCLLQNHRKIQFYLVTEISKNMSSVFGQFLKKKQNGDAMIFICTSEMLQNLVFGVRA